jgi:hypothetical protein
MPDATETPAFLDPGLAPGGLVFQTYRVERGGGLLFEHRMDDKTRPDELDYPDEIDLLPGEHAMLLVYDGDTGELVMGAWQLVMDPR